jgi:chemotaxis protein methyltransferase CheR
MDLGAILADLDYPALKRFILDYTGLFYFNDKDEDLATRLARRFSAKGAASCSEYLKLLTVSGFGDSELDSLVGELTIGETYFFRQPEHFRALREAVFPELLERKSESRRIRVWSAGCATGAEPYSIAILLDLDLRDRVAGWDISILATDINTEFLARAREAHYREWAFRETPAEVRQRCFERDGDTWVLKPEFRARVSFRRHNLAEDEEFATLGGPFDLILCRNVMIYFNPELIRKTAAAFHRALAPGGWLAVGHAELNVELFEDFSSANPAGVTFYRKLDPESAPKGVWGGLQPAPPARQPARPVPARAPGRRPEGLRHHAKPIDTPLPDLERVRLLADRGEWKAAAAMGRRLIEADPLNPPAHFTLGLILEHTVSCEEAERSQRRAIYLDRGFALAHYHLGTCLERGRRPEEARKAFRNVLQLLVSRPADELIEHGDGMTVSELKELARMHIQLLGGA